MTSVTTSLPVLALLLAGKFASCAAAFCPFDERTAIYVTPTFKYIRPAQMHVCVCVCVCVLCITSEEAKVQNGQVNQDSTVPRENHGHTTTNMHRARPVCASGIQFGSCGNQFLECLRGLFNILPETSSLQNSKYASCAMHHSSLLYHS